MALISEFTPRHQHLSRNSFTLKRVTVNRSMRKILITIFASLLLPLSVLAVTVTDEIVLTLPSTGDSYGLVATSNFTTLTVNNDNFVIVLAGGDGFRLRSTDRRKLTNDAGISITCDTTESSISSGSGNVTVTITPSGTCGSSVSGGGVISSGGGGSSVTLAPVVTPPPTNVPASPVPAPKIPLAVFTRDIALGSIGDDVTQLQALLASDTSIYPQGMITGYYGPLTVQAVKRFQAKYGLPQIGRVGPMTREKLMQVFGSKSSTSATEPSPVPQNPSGRLLTKTLKGRTQDEEVNILQEFLAKNSEIYPQGQITGYFGPLTDNAVKRFQAKYGIEKVGIVGPVTRAKINELIKDGQNP